jgi:hypothetical protein
MPTIKIACPKCGQKVSGDETFLGSSVECPVCSAEIRFPGKKGTMPSPTPFPAEIPPPPAKPETVGAASQMDDWLPETAPMPKQALPLAPVPGRPEPHPRAETREPRSNVVPPAPVQKEIDEDPADIVPSPLAGAVAMVSATLSIVSCGVFGIVFAPIAIIAGHTALAQARHSPVRPAPGQTIGAVGMVLGYLSLALTIVILLVLVFFGGDLREWLSGWSA